MIMRIITETQSNNDNLVWEIKGWRELEHKFGKVLSTPVFDLCSHRWVLHFYPKGCSNSSGESNENEGFLTLYCVDEGGANELNLNLSFNLPSSNDSVSNLSINEKFNCNTYVSMEDLANASKEGRLLEGGFVFNLGNSFLTEESNFLNNNCVNLELSFDLIGDTVSTIINSEGNVSEGNVSEENAVENPTANSTNDPKELETNESKESETNELQLNIQQTDDNK